MNEGNNKNLVLAMALMLGVWLTFSILFPPQQQQPAEVVQPSGSTEQSAAAPADVVNRVIQPQPSVVVEPVAPILAPTREITVETSKYRAVFTSAGARLVSFELKDYGKTAAADAPPVQLIKPGAQSYYSLRTTGTEGFSLLENAPFKSDAPAEINISPGAEETLIFKGVTGSGVEVVKTFRLHGDQYTIDSRVEFVNRSQSVLRGAFDFALVQQWTEDLQPDSYSFAGPATLVGEDINEDDVDDLDEKPVVYGSDAIWTSFQTKYFLSVAVPAQGAFERVRVRKEGDAVVNLMESPSVTLQPGESRHFDCFLYVGPKDYELLKSSGHQLDKVIDFGFFDILAKPLFHVLIYFYGFLQNYGLSIILLTVIIKLIFWPLTHKSYSSMKAMQKLQPEMQKVREKHKNDKERLNKELMELYKTHRVNPFGGCLPMLVQIPVFFALYQVLLGSIALRHAPFAFWLTDLSAKDPYYITPVLMGISMFVQQKMTPTQADPMQAKIFMMMPIVFTFMFLNFPSGLVIYWLVNNLLTIVQQYYIHRKSA